MASSQKLPEDLSTDLSVKMEEQFKPNLQILSSKGNTNGQAVFSVLSNQNPNENPSQGTFNAPSLFSNNVHSTENDINSDRIGNQQNLTFASIPARSHDHGDTTAHLSGYATNGSSRTHSQAPTIFSAALNSANLLSSGVQNVQVSSHSAKQDGGIETNSGGQTYNHSIGLVTSLPSSSQNYAPTSGTIQQLVYSQTSSNNPYAQNQNQSTFQDVDGTQHNTQQPTYVLLQAPGDGENGGPPQVFLAMQTTGIASQDSGTPYITLQPVSVDGDLSNNTLVQEGVNLQQAVLSNNGTNDIKTGSMSNENGQQVVLSIPGQQSILSSGSNNNGSLVTYLQPLGNLGVPVSNMDQNQVIITSSDLQGNLTVHNVPGLGNKRNASSTRQSSQVNLTTPRRRLSTDPRSCDQCGRTFKYPSDLKKHLQIHTDVKKFACDDCNRSFRRLHQLNVHRRIHTGEKPYVCNRCNAQFRHDSTLTMHIRTRHDHLKPFTCDGCSKKFGRMSHLRKHQRNVCGRSSVRLTIAQCKYCDAVFNKKVDLKAHFNVCDKKPERVDKEIRSPSSYECETCGKYFSRVYDFKRHQLSHSDEKPYGCPQCGKTFKERSSLNKHVKRMHCSEGDGTIPIDDDGIIADDDEEEDDQLSVDDENESCLSINDNIASSSNVKNVVYTQSGVITNTVSQVVTANGQTIPASEILNFPGVAEALGINSGAHATVLDSDGNSTMIAITQPGNLETSEVSMDMEQNIMQDGSIIVTDNTENNTEQYMTTNEHLNQIAPVDDPESIDGIPVIYNPDNVDSSSASSIYTTSLASSMVFKREIVDDQPFVLKHEEDIADHVKAEQAAAHDLQPEEDSSILEE